MRVGTLALLVALYACVPVRAQEVKDDQIVRVVRLKAGASKDLEMELPYGVEFRPGGSKAGSRDTVTLVEVPQRFSGDKHRRTSLKFGDEFINLGGGLEARWHKAGVTFRAGQEAKAGSREFVICYFPFGNSECRARVRIAVEAP